MSSLADEKARAEKWLARRREYDPAGARNFATAPTIALAHGETRVCWSHVSAGARPGVDVAEVPITPRSSGRVRVSCIGNFTNESESDAEISIRAIVDGAAADDGGSRTFRPGASGFVSFDFDCLLPLGRTSRVAVIASAPRRARLRSATLDLQEITKR